MFFLKREPLTLASQPDYTTFDIIGELMYGESFDCLNKSEMHPWVALIFDYIRAGEIIIFCKRYTITRSLINVLLGKTMAAKRTMHKALTKEKTERRTGLGAEGSGQKDFMWSGNSQVSSVFASKADFIHYQSGTF